MRQAVVLSCEHASARVPARWAPLFAGQERVLASHRGSDRGALSLARELARRLDAPLCACTTTRLLADANRSAGHPRVFSEWTRVLPETERLQILARCWAPHREAVEAAVLAALRRGGRVLHVSVHSFAPRLGGTSRGCDVGLLYDPARAAERTLCARWRGALRETDPLLRVRRNHPYRGAADGLTTALRRRFAPTRYLGIELEVSQGLRGSRLAALPALLAQTLVRALGKLDARSSSRRTAPALPAPNPRGQKQASDSERAARRRRAE